MVAGVGAGVAVLTFIMSGDGKAGGIVAAAGFAKDAATGAGHLRLRSEY